MLDLLIIAFIIVFITDLTDVWDYIKKWIWDLTFNHTKPYTGFHCKLMECSLCQIWWVGLIYLLITSSFTIPYIGYVALLSFLSPVLKDILLFLKDTLTTIIIFLNKINL